MYINPVLVDDLDDLTAPLDMDDPDLTGVLCMVEHAAELAVPSLLGWKLTFTSQGQLLTLTSMHPLVHTGNVRASLHVPLSSVLRLPADGRVTLYAAQPGAFTMLAADLAAALQLHTDQLCLDQNLQPDLTSGLTGLRELSAMNQAIGAQIQRGHTPARTQTHVDQQPAVTDLNAHRRRKLR